MRTRSFIRRLALASIAASLIAAPVLAEDATPNPAGATPVHGDAVYKAFHEQAGIHRIVDDLLVRVSVDPRIKRRFEDADMPHLNLMLSEQICYLIGGPCQYTGKDMGSAHEGRGLTSDDFNALAEDLQLAMDKERVDFNAQNRLLAKLAPMQRLVVSR